MTIPKKAVSHANGGVINLEVVCIDILHRFLVLNNFSMKMVDETHRAFQNLTEGYMLISTKSVYLSYNA